MKNSNAAGILMIALAMGGFIDSVRLRQSKPELSPCAEFQKYTTQQHLDLGLDLHSVAKTEQDLLESILQKYHTSLVNTRRFVWIKSNGPFSSEDERALSTLGFKIDQTCGRYFKSDDQGSSRSGMSIEPVERIVIIPPIQ